MEKINPLDIVIKHWGHPKVSQMLKYMLLNSENNEDLLEEVQGKRIEFCLQSTDKLYF